VELVCHGPPDVAKRGETSDDISQIYLVMPCVHGSEAPFVVRVKQDDVRFDAERLKVFQSSFVVRKEFRVEAIEVDAAVRCFDVRETRRLDVIEYHPFRKDKEANLGERIFRKSVQSPAFQLRVAVQPVVQGRAEGKIRRPVRIGEVVRVLDPDGTVMVSAGGTDEKCPRFATELRIVR